MQTQAFNVLLLLARPAAGKSEIIHYLKSVSVAERLRRFHIGRLDEIDDFPMLWAWFEEDDLLHTMGHPRSYTTPNGYFKQTYLWDLLIRRIGLEYQKHLRDRRAGEAVTTLVEFSRGNEHGGYQRAFQHLSPELLKKAAILYVRVSYEESLRKNRKRFNPDRPDSILQHGLPDEKMERLYRHDDWDELSGGKGLGQLELQGIRVPFAVLENEDDVTTGGGELLAARLDETLGRLWETCRKAKEG
jgi:hypothetical protein